MPRRTVHRGPARAHRKGPALEEDRRVPKPRGHMPVPSGEAIVRSRNKGLPPPEPPPSMDSEEGVYRGWTHHRTVLFIHWTHGGEPLRATLVGWDRYQLIVKVDGRTQVVYKHAVARLEPALG